MTIEIKCRYTSKTLYECDAESLKSAVEKAVAARANLFGADLSDADLSGADLSDADLSRANLSRANLSDADLSDADLSDADLSRADLYGAYLSDADLSDANLFGANLSDADLFGANLSDADLSRADGYRDSHDFFAEIVKRADNAKITDAEWSFIGQVTIRRFCWDVITDKFSDVAMSLFEKLADQGYTEWRDYFKTITTRDAEEAIDDGDRDADKGGTK